MVSFPETQTASFNLTETNGEKLSTESKARSTFFLSNMVNFPLVCWCVRGDNCRGVVL